MKGDKYTTSKEDEITMKFTSRRGMGNRDGYRFFYKVKRNKTFKRKNIYDNKCA